MRILDRYIGKMFAASYLFTFLSIMGFYIVVDLVSNVDEFMKDKSFLDAAALVGRYYLYNTPIIFLNVSPIITLMAAMFAIVRLLRSNEHIPIFASGVSMRRAMAPIFVLALCVTGLIVLVQEVIVPNNAVKIADLFELKRKNKQWVTGFVGGDELNNLIVVGEYHVDDREIRRAREENEDLPSVWVLFRDEQFHERKILMARRAAWTRDANGDKRWHFYNYKIWNFDANGLISSGLPETGEVYVASQEDLDLRPEDVRNSRDENMYLSTLEIIRRWQRDPKYVRLGVLANSRLAYPVLNMLLLLVGIPFVLFGDTHNAFGGVGRTLAISGAFFAVIFVSQDLGNKGELSPVLSAWLPVALFGALGIKLWDNIRT